MYDIKSPVCVTGTQSYDYSNVLKSVERHFEMLDLKSRIKPSMKVVVKVNLLMKRKPEEVTTTHPAMVKAIIECLKAIGVSKIIIADSPGGPYTKAALTGIYEASGMRTVSEETGAELNFDLTSSEVKSENGRMVNGFTIITPILESDFIIDAAKLKSHAMTGLSGGVKNLFGTIPGLMKPEFHWRFPQKEQFCSMLVDLCETVKPSVTFVDAVISMEGDGPSGGTPIETGMIISGYNPYNVDLALTKVIGVKEDEIFTVVEAKDRGFCQNTAEKLEFVGDDLKVFENYKMPKGKRVTFYDSVPKLLRKPAEIIASRVFNSRPVIVNKKCIGCGKCAESCPAKTIDIKSHKAVIDYKNCIKCYCCHEMCPVKAIKIKRTRIFDL